MNREAFLRKLLWLAALANVGGACLFLFPASAPGELLGLPAAVPAVYRAFTGLSVLLFAGAYAWLAVHRPIVRPFVVFGAIGKASAFALALLLWMLGKVSGATVAVFSADLVLAALFAWCLAGQSGRQVAN